MDSSTLLGIIGLIVSVVFGVWGIYVVVRKKRYPGRIDLVIKSSIGLFDFIENWEELEVKYKDEAVRHNLVLLVAVWRNTGSIDITREMTVRRLAIKLPAGYRWLHGKKIDTASEVEAEAIVSSPTSLEFDYKLFKLGEHIRFEALAEVPSIQKDSSTQNVRGPGDRLANDLTIDYRIFDTRVGTIEDTLSLGLASKNRMRKSALASALVVAFCFAASFMWLPAKKQGPTYSMKDSSGNWQEVVIDFKRPGSFVNVTYVSSGVPETLELSEVKKRGYREAPDSVKWGSLILPFLLIVIPAPAAIFLTFFYFEKKRRRERTTFLAACEPYPPHGRLANES